MKRSEFVCNMSALDMLLIHCRASLSLGIGLHAVNPDYVNFQVVASRASDRIQRRLRLLSNRGALELAGPYTATRRGPPSRVGTQINNF